MIRGALERTERIIVIADGSKFASVAMSTVLPIEQVSTIVTDSSADPAEIDRIREAGVEVIVAGLDGTPSRASRNGTENGEARTLALRARA